MTEVITISIPSRLRKKIDNERGLISRSKYIVQKLEILSCENSKKQKNFDSSVSITAAKQVRTDESTNT